MSEVKKMKRGRPSENTNATKDHSPSNSKKDAKSKSPVNKKKHQDGNKNF